MGSLNAGGGWHAIRYSFKMANRVGWLKLMRAMSSRNACKTCALGMGGQKGGMRNELGHWPEVCKKSLQAMVSDMQDGMHSDFFKKVSINQMKSMSSRELEASGRLTTPIIAKEGATHFESISWEAVFDRIASKLIKTAPDESFFYFSGRSSNEAGFLLQLFARMYGTNHVNNCSFYCHQASGVGLTGALGTGTATVTLDDVEHADMFFLIGGNPSSNHPRLMTSLNKIRKNGGKVIVINPVVEKALQRFRIPSKPMSLFGKCDIATHYIQPHIGGDIAVLTGIAKYVLEQKAEVKSFIDTATEDYDAYKKVVKDTSWEKITEHSGLTKEDIVEVAELYCNAKNVIFSWTMGITHHTFGVENVQSIVNLGLLRGMVGRPNAGMLPIRGHSNVQGIGSMGVTPKLKKEIFERLEHLGIKLPTMKGHDTMSCMDAAIQGNMRFAWCLGGNLYGSNPDAAYAARSMNQIDQVVYLSTTLNTGHAFGTGKETIILPVQARDEEIQSTTQESMFNFIRVSDGGSQRLKGPKSEVSIVTEIASRVIKDSSIVNWTELKQHKNIRKLIASIIPGFDQFKNLDGSKKEFYIPGRILHHPTFPTPSGKAKFHAHKIPASYNSNPNQFVLMSVRSEGQFNTVVYEEEDLYRGQERRDILMMNDTDMSRLGLKHDDKVKVTSKVGSIHNLLVRKFDIRSGNVSMYYPEANAIIGRDLDPISKTPAFKATVVEITQL